jgi:hypothetical protein
MKLKTPATRVVCPAPGCKGVLFNISSKMAVALGVMTLQCDVCSRQWAHKVVREDGK